jgi:hypothetical protein
LKSSTEMRGTLLAAARRAQPPFQGRSGSSSGSGGTRRTRFSDGIGIPARPAARRVMRFGFGLRGRGKANTRPRAITMMSRRAAASAGRSSPSTVR